ncbi:transcription initiation factor IIA subunit 1 [Elysia marginata]|uniref:Transcription initiation factor IIA subunit 1 n=1 Tax=Elysia marginata TaxID=1093978 RepID=A0AAV4G4Z7_9GAST|nr:transcription initiation factor IIA subunit 1 [Elysia marginata]
MTTSSQVSKLYHTVVEDVINNVKEAFLDEGVDEQVLQELKQLWESKLAASKALEPPPIEPAELLLAPSTVPMRMPQPILKNTTVEGAAVPQAGQTQQVAGATAQVGQPPQRTLQYQPSEAAQAAAMALPAGIFRQHLATVDAGGQIQNIAVQQTGTGQYITLPQFQAQQQSQPIAIQPQQPQVGQHVRIPIQPQQFLHQQHHQQQPTQIFHASQLLQQQAASKAQQGLSQLDGNEDTSSSEDDDDFDVDDKDDEEKEEENEEEQREEEDPLNSADDVSEEDPTDLFDTENVVVCQYDKINRNKNKWKFHLKDGIMNLNGRDFVFQKATGDSEW